MHATLGSPGIMGLAAAVRLARQRALSSCAELGLGLLDVAPHRLFAQPQDFTDLGNAMAQGLPAQHHSSRGVRLAPLPSRPANGGASFCSWVVAKEAPK